MFGSHPLRDPLCADSMPGHVVEKPGDQNWRGPCPYSKQTKGCQYTENEYIIPGGIKCRWEWLGQRLEIHRSRKVFSEEATFELRSELWEGRSCEKGAFQAEDNHCNNPEAGMSLTQLRNKESVRASREWGVSKGESGLKNKNKNKQNNWASTRNTERKATVSSLKKLTLHFPWALVDSNNK